jgi:hypothetical protein
LKGVTIGPCVYGRHKLQHKLLGAGEPLESLKTVFEEKFKELSDTISLLQLKAESQAKLLKEFEDERKSRSYSSGSQSAPRTKVPSTNGKEISPDDESRQVQSFLGAKTMGKMLKGCDSLDVLLKYYMSTVNMDSITVPTAWTYLSMTLQTLNVKGEVQEAVNSYNSIKETYAQDMTMTWKELMSAIIEETGREETRKTLEKRLHSIPFTRAVKYEADFNEVLTLIEMIGKDAPTDTQLADIVKATIGKLGRTELKELLTYAEPDVSKGQTKTSLEHYSWTDLLSFRRKLESARAEMRVWKQQKSDPDLSSEDEAPSSKRRRRTGKNGRQNKKAKTTKGEAAEDAKKPDANMTPCFRCGKTNHSPPKCLFKNKECNTCKKKGHISAVCKSGKGKGDDKTTQKATKRKGGKPNRNKKQKKSKKKESSSDSSSDESSNLISLYATLDKELQEFETVVLSESKVEKPALPSTVNGLMEIEVLFDTGTQVDIINSGTLIKLRRENEKQGNTNKEEYTPCSITIKGAGGAKLKVLGKVFLTMDLGKGVKFQAIFVIVEDLGVPLLIGRRTMERIGLHICFTSPPRVETHVDGQKKIFPLNQQVAETINAYLAMYVSAENDAIHRAETTNANLRNPLFDGRVEEKVPNSQ